MKILYVVVLVCVFSAWFVSACAADAVTPMNIGAVDVAAIIDGESEFSTTLFPDFAARTDLHPYMPGGKSPSVYRVFLLRTGARVVLFDTGIGTAMPQKKGKLRQLLEHQGIAPEDVTDIVMTHLDIDHVGGLADNGQPVYPNAVLHVARAELEAWRNGTGLGKRDAVRPIALNALKAYESRIQLFEHGDSILPGVQSLAATGHTPGHSAFLVTGSSTCLYIAGDILHCGPVQLRDPSVSSGFDADPAAAAATRTRVLSELCDTDIIFAAMHIMESGRVRKAPDGGFMLVQ